MEKIKFAFIISLLFVLMVSIGSISAESINQDDFQISDLDVEEDNSIDDDILQNDGYIGETLENNNHDDKILENNDHDDKILENNDYDNDILGNNDLNEDVLSSDLDIEKEIKVSFSNVVYENDTGNISVELPDEASGHLTVAIDDEEIYNQTIEEKWVQIPIVIPKSKLPYLVINRNADYTLHNVSIFYNGLSIHLTNSTLKVMTYPPEHGFFLNVPKEILKGDGKSYQSVGLIFPYSAKGTVDVYLDDKFFQKFNASQYVFMNISKINGLSLGSHTIKAIYSGDGYYLPCERNVTFNVVDFLIDIPSNIVLDHDDCIYAKSVKYTDGTITVYFDGKKIISKKLDSSHEFLESLFDRVTCGEHTIEVKYSSSKFNYSKKQSVNISYVVDIWGGDFRYGDDNSVIITVPHDFNKKLIHITIDNKVYSSFKIDDDGWIEINVSKLYAGNHTLSFKFDGDKKYYPYSEAYNFSVRYDFKIPDFIHYLDGSVVSIDLPSTANGNLEVNVNGKLYKSVKVINGKASVKVDSFSCGSHNIILHYTGNDFEVENVSTSIDIYPKVISPIYITYGQDKYIEVQVSKDTKGKIIFIVGNKKYTAPIKDGKVRLSLKKLDIEEYYIDVVFIGEDGYECYDYTYVDVLGAKIKIKGAKNLAIRYTSKKYYKVKVYNEYSKLAKGVMVKFKVGKRTFKVKTNKYGVAKLKLSKLSKFAPKKYKITISYKGTKVTKYITVNHILKLKKAKVKKYARKLRLTAGLKKVDGKYLKGKAIKFKFNKKTYKAKTNKNGIAKVTIKRKDLKKLKAGKKITYQAIYFKDTAKRTVKVKA